MGDRLIVGVSTDDFNKVKGKKALFNYEQRAEIVRSCRYVNLVIPEFAWEQKREDIIKHSIDVFAIGDDWKGKFDFLNDICEVVYLPRTENISSTIIKEIIKSYKTSHEENIKLAHQIS